MTDGLINLLKKQITKAVSQEMGDENIALLFNTNPVPEERTAKLTLFTPEKNHSNFSPVTKK